MARGLQPRAVMDNTTRSRIEVLLAGIALTAVASIAACGGTTDGTSSGSSGPAGSSGSSGAGSSGTGTSSSGASGTQTCSNGKDPLCSCSLPGPQSTTSDYRGPPGSDAGAGDAGDGDGGAWTCEDECASHHPNGNGKLESCSFGVFSTPQKVTCTYYVQCVGRRPAGYEEPVVESTEARELLSAIAQLEEASVDAFLRLARELAHYRAPAALVARARDAAQDERRHARAMHALAARYGAESSGPQPRAKVRRAPGLADILIENATEGCVRETFGAVMAHVQALLATDPVVRRTMARIAVDESRHAALAWDIHVWGCTRVSARERRRIDEARQRAVRRLLDEVESGPRVVRETALGLVGSAGARTLALSLVAQLWDREAKAAA